MIVMILFQLHRGGLYATSVLDRARYDVVALDTCPRVEKISCNLIKHRLWALIQFRLERLRSVSP